MKTHAPSTSTEPWVRRALQACLDKKGLDLLALDVRGRSPVTDYFLLVTGNNPPHLKALANEVERVMKADGLRVYRRSGTPDSGWLVLDFLDFVVHLFLPDPRKFYDLEHLWKDAPQLPVPTDAEPAGRF